MKRTRPIHVLKLRARQLARELFSQLEPGDLILLAARPRQGKTVLALDVAVETLKAGHAASVFTLECTEAGVRSWLERQACDWRALRSRLRIDTWGAVGRAIGVHPRGRAARPT